MGMFNSNLFLFLVWNFWPVISSENLTSRKRMQIFHFLFYSLCNKGCQVQDQTQNLRIQTPRFCTPNHRGVVNIVGLVQIILCRAFVEIDPGLYSYVPVALLSIIIGLVSDF